MFLLGVLCFANVIDVSVLAKMSTVQYVNIWMYLSPGSEDPNSPTIVTAGKATTLTADLYYEDWASGWYSDPYQWTVEVRVYEGTLKVQTVALSISMYVPPMGYESYAEWTGSWTVPSKENVLYNLEWYVDTKDSGTTTKNTYAKTPLNEPNGVFKVNGKDSSTTATHYVVSPTLSLLFQPTSNAEKVTGVYVEVWQGGTKKTSVTLSKQTSGDYTGTYTLPSYGAYELRGYIEWSGGSPLRKMSVLATYGNGDGGDGGGEGGGAWSPFWINQIVGSTLMVLGACLIAAPAKSRRTR